MSDVEKIIDGFKSDANRLLDKQKRTHADAYPNTIDVDPDDLLTLIAEYERLKGIVDALPKMADGAIIQLGMPAWVQAVSGPLPRLVETMQWEGGSVWVNGYEPGDLYSTKDAATKGDPNAR